MKSRMKADRVDVPADYEAAAPMVLCGVEESLDNEWLEEYENYLNSQPRGHTTWATLKRNGGVRKTLDIIHGLTAVEFVESTEGEPLGNVISHERELYTELKKRFAKAGKLISQIKELTSYSHPHVIEMQMDKLMWPEDRKAFRGWIDEGEAMALRLQMHFKTMSHASRQEINESRFIGVVLALRYRYKCTFPEAALLIASGWAASGRKTNADAFDGWKLKEDLKRLRQTFPDLYKNIEGAIKASL